MCLSLGDLCPLGRYRSLLKQSCQSWFLELVLRTVLDASAGVEELRQPCNEPQHMLHTERCVMLLLVCEC